MSLVLLPSRTDSKLFVFVSMIVILSGQVYAQTSTAQCINVIQCVNRLTALGIRQATATQYVNLNSSLAFNSNFFRSISNLMIVGLTSSQALERLTNTHLILATSSSPHFINAVRILNSVGFVGTRALDQIPNATTAQNLSGFLPLLTTPRLNRDEFRLLVQEIVQNSSTLIPLRQEKTIRIFFRFFENRTAFHLSAAQMINRLSTDSLLQNQNNSSFIPVLNQISELSDSDFQIFFQYILTGTNVDIQHTMGSLARIGYFIRLFESDRIVRATLDRIIQENRLSRELLFTALSRLPNIYSSVDGHWVQDRSYVRALHWPEFQSVFKSVLGGESAALRAENASEPVSIGAVYGAFYEAFIAFSTHEQVEICIATEPPAPRLLSYVYSPHVLSTSTRIGCAESWTGRIRDALTPH